MKRKVILWLAAAVFGLALQSSAQTGPNGPNGPSPNPNAPGGGNDIFAPDVNHRTFVVTGTVVRLTKGQMGLRIDDGRHLIPFEMAPGADRDVRAGSHVAVTYHPTGTTGQVADQVRVF
jgi:hypothetical protein